MATVQKWGYALLPIAEMNNVECEESLDYWGAEGWELVTVSDGTAYLRRPIQPEVTRANAPTTATPTLELQPGCKLVLVKEKS